MEYVEKRMAQEAAKPASTAEYVWPGDRTRAPLSGRRS